MAEKTYDLMDEIKRLMDESGETPNGKLAMAILLLNDRLTAWEATMNEATQFDYKGDAVFRCTCPNCE